MKLWIVLLLIVGCGANSFAQSICSASNLELLVTSGMPAFAKNEFTHQLANSKVVVAGEIHFYTELKSRLDTIKQFNALAYGKKCIAYEWAVQDYDFIEFLNRISILISSLKDGSFQKSNPSVTNNNVDKLLASFQQVYDYYWPMAELTQKLGMKAVMVDHKDHSFSSSKTMDERNVAMAENINALFSNGSCDSLLFFVGKAHLAKNTDSTTRVQDLIKSHNLNAITVNLQMTNESLPVQIRSWSICPISQSLKLKDYAFFKNTELEQNYTLFPYMQNEQITWKDFDFTLLSP